jgi:DNA-directed RNA polymerase specialized sigma24 family protein
MNDAVPALDRDARFDRFYRESRDRLLLQTYAMTGDLGASRSAVRDAFVVAWHHWRKLVRLESPENAVRPQALRNAARRATVRPWHREKNLDPEAKATLDALASLTVVQRKALVLTQLAAVSMPEVAREIGITQEAAERELQLAASTFSTAREIPAASIPVLFAELGKATESVTWPRVTIIRRAGAARRRAHTVVGAVAAAAVLAGSGAAVTDSTGVHPTLARDLPSAPTGGPLVADPQIKLPDTSLLPEDAVRSGLPSRKWRIERTDDNSTGSPVVHFCQDPRERYADPHGSAAWVRVFRDGTRKDATRALTQSAEASVSPAAARKAYLNERRWFAGCTVPQTQLISTSTSPTTGDDAALFVLREQPTQTTYVVGVARTGLFTTALTLQTDVVPGHVDLDGVADLLGTAVERLCDLPDGGKCAATPAKVEAAPAYPAGAVPAMLSELDLPPIGTKPTRWAAPDASEITPGSTSTGLIGCSSIVFAGSFRGKEFKHALVRDWVLPDADLPPEVGLTQTVASLPPGPASDLVAQVRDQVAKCPDEDAGAGTDVQRLAGWDHGDQSLTAWHLVTRVTKDKTIEYDVAIMRDKGAVSQVTYVAAKDAPMPADAFVALAQRALERLGTMPSYRSH